MTAPLPYQDPCGPRTSRGRKIAEDLSSGTIDVNNVSYTFGLVSTPWGGKGDSGFGRTHGKWGFEELMDLHHVHTDKGKNPMEIWWHPYNQKKLDASEGLIEHGFFKKIGGAISFLKNF